VCALVNCGLVPPCFLIKRRIGLPALPAIPHSTGAGKDKNITREGNCWKDQSDREDRKAMLPKNIELERVMDLEREGRKNKRGII